MAVDFLMLFKFLNREFLTVCYALPLKENGTTLRKIGSLILVLGTENLLPKAF